MYLREDLRVAVFQWLWTIPSQNFPTEQLEKCYLGRFHTYYLQTYPRQDSVSSLSNQCQTSNRIYRDLAFPRLKSICKLLLYLLIDDLRQSHRFFKLTHRVSSHQSHTQEKIREVARKNERKAGNQGFVCSCWSYWFSKISDHSKCR